MTICNFPGIFLYVMHCHLPPPLLSIKKPSRCKCATSHPCYSSTVLSPVCTPLSVTFHCWDNIPDACTVKEIGLNWARDFLAFSPQFPGFQGRNTQQRGVVEKVKDWRRKSQRQKGAEGQKVLRPHPLIIQCPHDAITFPKSQVSTREPFDFRGNFPFVFWRQSPMFCPKM